MIGSRTPTRYYKTIPAGESLTVDDYGLMLSVLDITPVGVGVTTIEIGCGEDPFRLIDQGVAVELPQGSQFTKVRFHNQQAVSVAVLFYLSEGRVYDNRLMTQGLVLESIDNRVSTSNTHLNNIKDSLAISSGGDAEIVSIAATTADNGANQVCKEATFWTPDAHIHFKLGSTACDGTKPLLPVNAPFTIPIENTNLLRFYNGAAAAATVNIIWRN